MGSSKRSKLRYARWMYWGFYLSIGAYIPFINLYYKRLGLSGLEIGALAALPVFVSSLISLVWGGIADKLQWHRQMLSGAFLLSPIIVFFLSKATDFASLMPLVLLYALVSSPIIPLLDSAAVEIAKANRRSYGDLRVWGAIGWMISTWLVGLATEKWGIHSFFYCFMALILIPFAVSLFQPQRESALKTSLRSSVIQLLKTPRFNIFLTSIFIVAFTSNAVQTFFSIYMDGIGAKGGTIGLAYSIASLSEIPVMLGAGFLMKKIGAAGLLKVAFFTYALRWFLFSLITNPGLAIAVQLLHGLSFGSFLVGGVTYLSERTPPGLGTTSQAIFSSVAFGLASIAGSITGGYMLDQIGMTNLLVVLSLVALAGLVIFSLFSPKSETVNQYL